MRRRAHALHPPTCFVLATTVWPRAPIHSCEIATARGTRHGPLVGSRSSPEMAEWNWNWNSPAAYPTLSPLPCRTSPLRCGSRPAIAHVCCEQHIKNPLVVFRYAERGRMPHPLVHPAWCELLAAGTPHTAHAGTLSRPLHFTSLAAPRSPCPAPRRRRRPRRSLRYSTLERTGLHDDKLP